MELPKIKSARVAVISDLHLGVHSNSSHWHNIAYDWAKWLKKELLDNNIEDIIFCGDWYHSRSEISVLTLQASANILDILSDFNILMIVGNHDMYYKHRTDVNSLSVFKSRKNITVFDEVYTLDRFNKTISFCPWNTNMKDVPKSDVIFSHLELNTFRMNTSKVCDNGIGIQDVLDVSPLVISGHFHARQERKYGDAHILYVGNPFHMDFSDAGNQKGYYILDFNDLSYSFHENDISPRHEKVKLSEIIKNDGITQNVVDLIKGNTIKFKVDVDITHSDAQFLFLKLNELGPDSFEIDYDNMKSISSIGDCGDMSGIDIKLAISEFIAMLDIENKEEVEKYTIDLYDTCKK